VNVPGLEAVYSWAPGRVIVGPVAGECITAG
jgi:hypothetical protein